MQDNGDGSQNTYIYNDIAELLADFRKYHTEEQCSDDDLLNEEDPYENGYISSSVIEFDTETGRFKPFSVSGG